MNQKFKQNEGRDNQEWDESVLENELQKQEQQECQEQQEQEKAEAAVKSPVPFAGSGKAASPNEGFTNTGEFPESPFLYTDTNQIQVQLSSGHVQYEVTDFVLPGRDGFDLAITRRYHSGCANLTEMGPYMDGKQIKTGSRDNDHYTRTYGLGYGWSFVLPSIETRKHLDYDFFPYTVGETGEERWDLASWDVKYNHILHTVDGRSFGISSDGNHILNYQLEDVKISSKSESDDVKTSSKPELKTIEHPNADGETRDYHTVVSDKYGNKDYFKRVLKQNGYGNYWSRYDYQLVARQDKFGNTMLFTMEEYGGMTIVDTWGRTIQLSKTPQGFTWTLPGGNPEEKEQIHYHIDREKELKLTKVINPLGHETRYDYYDPQEHQGEMQYVDFSGAGNSAGCNERPYLLLRTIIHPDQSRLRFAYERQIKVKHGSGGFTSHFPLTVKANLVEEREYNRTEYSYELDKTGKFIERAVVRQHGDVLEHHEFNRKGFLQKKEIRHGEALISSSVYEYDKDCEMLMTSATDKVFNRENEEKFMQTKRIWTYSEDKKANVVVEQEMDPEQSRMFKHYRINYGDYNMVIASKHMSLRFLNQHLLRETNELDPELGNRVVKVHRVYDAEDVLKEKTVYAYGNQQNPYCVTSKRQYIQSGEEDLEQSTEFVETFYNYDGSQCTHQVTSTQQREIHDADGQPCLPINERTVYDRRGRVIAKINAENQMTRIRYDALGRVVEKILPSPADQPIIHRITYNDDENYMTKTDANGHKTRIYYTPFGQVKKVCLAMDEEPVAGDVVLQEFEYSPWGELAKVLTYDGNGTGPAHVKKTEQYTYDSFGRVLSRSIPQVGYEETYRYEEAVDPSSWAGDEYHLCEKIVKGDKNAPAVKTQIHTNRKGQVVKECLAQTTMVTWAYDYWGNKINKGGAQSPRKKWTYDYAGRVLTNQKVIEPISYFVYDTLGNKRFSWQGEGQKTEFCYDQAGRLIQIIAPFDHRRQITKYYYNGIGQMIKEKKIIKELDAQQEGWQETRYSYDEAGRLIATDQYLGPDQWIRTRYWYDAMGNLLKMRTGDTPSTEGQQTTAYTYDRIGHVMTMTDARGCREYYQYDGTGRLQEKTDRNGNRTVYQYDALDRLLKERSESITADGKVVSEREYGYSKSGKKIRQAIRESGGGKPAVFWESKYFYDNKGQLIRQEDPDDVVKTYQHTVAGNRTFFEWLNKKQRATRLHLSYNYNSLHCLKQVDASAHNGKYFARVQYEYDEKGNRKKFRHYPTAGPETFYQYNEAGRITALETREGEKVIASWEYAYDQHGNLCAKTDKTGAVPVTITYRYDLLGRLIEEDYPGWKRTIYTYDEYSNRTKMMVEGKNASEPVSVTNYQYGQNNLLEKETRKQGKITETWQYRYDQNGNEIFRIWEKTAPTPDYPGRAELCGNRPRKNPTVYEWRHYNGFNQLIRINQDNQEITYQYQSDGLRHQSEVYDLTSGERKTTLWYWDQDHLVAERNDEGQLKQYVRGAELIAEKVNDVVYYYVHNEHGDVIWLQEQGGTCRAKYEYDAFGNEREPYDGDENPFRYCGEYWDLSSGTYYLRARDYRPTIGRFLTADPIWTGYNPNDASFPENYCIMQNINRYVYCVNNPVIFIDPSGLALVNIDDYVKARGGVTKIYEVDGKKHISVTYNKINQNYTYYNSGNIDDIVLNETFGWESFLTDSDRDVNVGISILSGVLYKDFSIPVNNALKNAEPKFSSFKNKGNPFWFMNQVNHGRAWDIKREDPWNRTIAFDTYPGRYDTSIVINGEIVTLEQLGNMTYGYLGTACGFSEFVLLAGGDYAAGGIKGVFIQADSEADKTAVKRGIEWYKNR